MDEIDVEFFLIYDFRFSELKAKIYTIGYKI